MQTLKSARSEAEATFAIYLPGITDCKYLVSHFPFFFSKYTQKNWWGITQWNQFSHTPCSSNQLSLLEKELILLHILPAHGPQLSAFSTDRLPLLNSHPFPTTASHLKTDQEGADIKAWHSLPTSDNIEVHRAIQLYKGFPGAWAVMNPLALQETWVWSLGQEDGIPLQHLWIGNPMKWRAWLAAVHGVAKELDTT